MLEFECSRFKKKFKPSLYLKKKYVFESLVLCESCIYKQQTVNDLLWKHKRFIPNIHRYQDHTLKPKNLFQQIKPKTQKE